MNYINRENIKLITIVIFLISSSLFAKEKMVTLQTKIDGKNHILKIDKMDVKVNIIGNIAETSLDITFKNKLNKMIEGTLYLPMKENASIFEYQFEMNDSKGKPIMKKGVIVEKKKARVAYEEIVRQKVDPGLLIWTKGNNFKTRIYPINAKSTKRIIVSYQEELTDNFNKNCAGKCPSYIYSLPLSIKYKISKFSVKVNGNGSNIYSMGKKRNRFISKKDKLTLIDENYAPNENIKLGVFNKEALARKSIVNMSYNKSKKNYYFTATVFPDKFNIKKKNPQNLCIYWDNSMSMTSRNIDKELEFMKKYTKYLKEANIALINFSNKDKLIGEFEVKNGNFPKQLANKLKNSIYDGGTQLGSINTKKAPISCEEALIFTDGVSNFGNKTPKLTIPTYFINTKLTAEHSYMKLLANKSGGSYINLHDLSIKKALKVIKNQKYKFISIANSKDAWPSISTSASTNIKEIWPNSPVEVRDSFTITGIVKATNTSTSLSDRKLILNFGLGKTIKQTITVNLNGDCKDKSLCLSQSPMIERQFARHKIASMLEMNGRSSLSREIISVSKKFSILTELTSFLVLETLNDYLKYKIIPPKDMQEEYFKVLESQKVQKEKSLNNQVEKVLKKYNELKNYWSAKHKTEKEIIEDIKKEKEREKLRKFKKSIGRALSSFGSSRSSTDLNDARSAKSVMAEESGAQRERSFSRRARVSAKKKSKTKGSPGVFASIELKAFDPNTPYLKKLNTAKKDYYKLYLELKKDYEKSSSFYLDVSNFFMMKGKNQLALRILSNIAELELDNHELLRILGYRLWQLKKYNLASYTFKEVLKMRPEEPQSFRDLGLTYRNMKKYQKSIKYLYKVATNDWDSRFSDIDLIALYEMNAVIAKADKTKLDLSKIDKRLIDNLPVDIRVVLSWDANDTDIDLWVTDPYGVKCFYSNKRTKIGGWNSNDFTGGYGPEMFILRNAHSGKYKIQANYYGSSSQKLTGEVTLHLELFLNYGKKNQVKKEIVLRVKGKKEIIDIGEFKVNVDKDGIKLK